MGLFARATASSTISCIPQVTKWCAGKSAFSSARLSMGLIFGLMKEGKTLGNLILREGREAVEKRVIEKAHQDPIFAFDRRSRAPADAREVPGRADSRCRRATNIIVENGRNYGSRRPDAADRN